MNVTIEPGMWMVPTAITVAAFIGASFMTRQEGNDPYGAGAFIELGIYMIAAIVSLASWLLWALL